MCLCRRRSILRFILKRVSFGNHLFYVLVPAAVVCTKILKVVSFRKPFFMCMLPAAKNTPPLPKGRGTACGGGIFVCCRRRRYYNYKSRGGVPSPPTKNKVIQQKRLLHIATTFLLCIIPTFADVHING